MFNQEIMFTMIVRVVTGFVKTFVRHEKPLADQEPYPLPGGADCFKIWGFLALCCQGRSTCEAAPAESKSRWNCDVPAALQSMFVIVMRSKNCEGFFAEAAKYFLLFSKIAGLQK